jgi:hypothetical protein
MKKLILIVSWCFVALCNTIAQNNVGIGTTTPNASAILDVESTTQGVLMPRMTEAQRNAISAPVATGLLVYQTDGIAGFYFYNGSAWTNLNGTNGQSVPTGGTAGQVLSKVDATNFNAQWTSPTGDNLGNHTATQDLAIGGNSITAANNITATGTATLSGNTYPTTTGTNGQKLTTNGAGVLSWASASISGPQVVFQASIAASPVQSLPAAVSITSPNAVNFNNIITPATSAISQTTVLMHISTLSCCANGPGFTINEAGNYMIICNLASAFTNNSGPVPLLEINPSASNFTTRIYGTNTTSVTYFQTHGKSRGMLNTVYYFNAGDTFTIRAQALINSAITLNGDLSGRLIVMKL